MTAKCLCVREKENLKAVSVNQERSQIKTDQKGRKKERLDAY